MAIGTISSPASWSLGTVAAPSWFQNVQDNVNGLIAGTGPTLKALQIDGTGGASSALASGNLAVSGASTFTGGATFGAKLISNSAAAPTFTTSSAAGTGPTVSFGTGSNDTAGLLNITIGTGPSANQRLINVKLASGGSRTSPCHAVIFPVGTTTAAQAANIAINYNGNDWAIDVGSVALTAAVQYSWMYLVIESA